MKSDSKAIFSRHSNKRERANFGVLFAYPLTQKPRSELRRLTGNGLIPFVFKGFY